MKFYHVETQEDYDALGIPSWAKWLARDKDGGLYAYDVSPHGKSDGIWVMESDSTWQRVRETDDTFKDIEWTDQEPTQIKRGLEAGGVSVEELKELNSITNAKAHGYDEVPTTEKSKVYNGKTIPENAKENDIWFEKGTIDGKQVTIMNLHNGTTFKPIDSAVTDIINKPNHYVGIQGLEVETVLQNFIPRYTDSYEAHRIASAIEYLLRSPLKNGTEDVKKAKKNIEQVLSYRETQNK